MKNTKGKHILWSFSIQFPTLQIKVAHNLLAARPNSNGFAFGFGCPARSNNNYWLHTKQITPIGYAFGSSGQANPKAIVRHTQCYWVRLRSQTSNICWLHIEQTTPIRSSWAATPNAFGSAFESGGSSPTQCYWSGYPARPNNNCWLNTTKRKPPTCATVSSTVQTVYSYSVVDGAMNEFVSIINL